MKKGECDDGSQQPHATQKLKTGWHELHID